MSRFFVNLSLRFYRFLPWLLGLTTALLALGGALLAAVYWWVLPHIAEYRGELAQILSRATGYEISIGGLAGEWQGARPRLEVSALDIRNAQGQVLLHVGRMEGRFGWLSFLLLKPRFYTLNVYDTPLVLRRVSPDLLYVGGLPVHLKGKGNGAFRDWLLDQGHVRWVNGTVTWIDQMDGAPPLVFTDVQAELRNFFTFHRFTLHAAPPPALAAPVEAQGQLTHRGFLGDKHWSGTLTLNVSGLSLQNFRPWLPPAYASLAGGGSLGLTLTLRRDEVAAWSAQPRLRKLVVPLGGAAPLRLSAVQGEGGWKQAKGTATWYAHNLRFQAAGAPRAGRLNFTYSAGPAGRSLQASELDLAALLPLSGALPQDWALAPAWQAMQPSGRIDTLDAAWSGPAARPELEHLSARFHHLAWLPWKNIPGVTGLSGDVQGGRQQGRFRLQGPISLAIPQVMSQPNYGFAQFQARGDWRRAGSDWLVSLSQLEAGNPDLDVSVTGSYSWDGNGPGRADLRGRIVRAEAAAVWRYIPCVVNPDVADWLHKALLAGRGAGGDFVLRGKLAGFPFADGKSGEFRVSLPVQGVRLRFADTWPALDGIDGALAFQGKGLGIRVQQGRFGGARLHDVSADIVDLGSHDAQLELTGEASGPAQDVLNYVNASPVAEHLHGLTRGLHGEGAVKLKLALHVPLAHARDTTVQGKVLFEGNRFATPGSALAVERLRGTLDFTDASVQAHRLAMQVLGGPATVNIDTRAGAVSAQGQGTAEGTRLAALLGKSAAGRLQGQTAWSGLYRVDRREARLVIDSSLQGLDSSLPAPLAKPAGQALPLRYERISRSGEATDNWLTLGKLLAARWQQAPPAEGGGVLRGALAFDAPARLPGAGLFLVSGRLPALDLEAWQPLLFGGTGASLPPLSIGGLRIGSLRFLNRDFRDVALNGGERDSVLRVEVRSPQAQGVVSYRAQAGGGSLDLHFRHLDLPKSAPGTAAASGNVNFSRWPRVAMTVDNLVWAGLPLGQMQGEAHPTDAGVSIDRLHIANPDAQLDLAGQWREGGSGLTAGHVDLAIRNAGRLLARLGYPALVQGGSGELAGDLSWTGQPQDFALKNLGGTLHLEVRNGQFLKVNPGVGKLLGIISLQSLERRLSLNFRDLTERGFAFDRISATMRIADGVVYTDDFSMQGPSARVALSGLARLNDETVQLRLKIYPHLSESLAVAGAVAGGPLVGLGTLLAQKILSNPLEAITAQDYIVSGSWDHPDVVRPGEYASTDKDSAKP